MAMPMSEQQIGDQIAGKGEEDPDAEHSALRPRHVYVVGDHAQNRQRPDAIEPGYIATVSLYGWWHNSAPDQDYLPVRRERP